MSEAATPTARPLVLFVCTRNACRSQFGEALLRAKAGDRVEAASAGREPGEVHPLTIRALDEAGVSTAGLRSKSLAEFERDRRPKVVIAVCAAALEACPRVTAPTAEILAWPVDDPAAATGTDEERMAVFRRIRDEIARRIDAWLATTNLTKAAAGCGP